MMRIFVAILLAVSVNGELPEVGINYPQSATIQHEAAPLNSDPVIVTSNPIEHSAERLKTAYGVSSLKNNLSNPKIKLKIIRRHFGENRRQHKPIIVNEQLNKGLNNDKFKGYGKAKTHYQAPVDANVVKTLDSEQDALLIQNNQRQRIETWVDDYEPLKEEPSAFKEQEDKIARSSVVSKFSNFNFSLREPPMKKYGTPGIISDIHESKKSLENTYDTPISLDSRPSNVASGYHNSKSNEYLYRKPKYESDSTHEVPSTEIYDFLKSTYGVSKSLSDKYGVPKPSKTVRNPKPLEKSYDDMHAMDVAYGVSTHFNSKKEEPRNIKGVPKSLNNKHGQYKTMAKDDDHYRKNDTQFNVIPDYSDIDQPHSVKIDQEYDNSNDNYETRSNYYYDDFNDQDFSSHAYENSQVFPNEVSVNFDPHDSYGVPESPEPSKTYSAPFKFLASKMSPGIIGVTQAIIRPNDDYEEPATSSEPNFGNNHHSKGHNGDRTNHYSYQTREKPFNEQARSDQNIGYTRSRASFGNYGPAEEKIGGYHDRLDGYASERNADEEMPALYRFEYEVSDQGADQFGHRESRQFERTQGSYHVILPDGRKQIVDYEADEHGFKPRVRYEGVPQGYHLGPKSGYDSAPKSKSRYNYQRSGDLELRTRYSDQQTGYY